MRDPGSCRRASPAYYLALASGATLAFRRTAHPTLLSSQLVTGCPLGASSPERDHIPRFPATLSRVCTRRLSRFHACPSTRKSFPFSFSTLLSIRPWPKAGLNRQPDREVQLATRLSLAQQICLMSLGHAGLSLPLQFRSRPTWSDAPSPQPDAHRTAGYRRPDYVKAARPGPKALRAIRGLCRELVQDTPFHFRTSPFPRWQHSHRRVAFATAHTLREFDLPDVSAFTQPKRSYRSHVWTKIARTCLHPRVLALWVRTRLGHMNKPPKVSALTATFTICIRPFGSKAGLNRHPALARLPPGIPPWRWYSSRRQATWAQNFSKIASVGRVVPKK